MFEKKCVISMKRQHMDDIEEFKDEELETSVLKTINSSFLNRSADAPSESSSSSTSEDESESEAEPDADGEQQSKTQTGASPAPSVIVLDEEVKSDSPAPGPSRVQVDYEDITTVEPLATSTPYHRREEEAEDPDDMLWILDYLRAVKKEVREGRKAIREIKTEFLMDVKKTIKIKSKIYLPRLAEKRSKISTRINEVKKQKKRIDILLESLLGQKRDVDQEMDSLNYFLENFPES